MPSPPISPLNSPLKPYSYPAPSPSPQFEPEIAEEPEVDLGLAPSGNISSSEAANMNYPNIKFYKNNGLNVSDFKEWIEIT